MGYMTAEEKQRARQVLEQQRKRHFSKMASEARQQQFWNNEFAQLTHQDRMTAPVQNMPTQGGEEVNEEAPPVVQESRKERKKREELRKTNDMAVRQAQRQAELEADIWEHRSAIAEDGQVEELYGEELQRRREPITEEEELHREKELRDEKLKESVLIERTKLLEAGDDATEQEKLQIRWEQEDERAKILGDYARMLPIGSKARAKAMEEKEEQEIRADKLHKQLKVMQIVDSTERGREEKTLARHARYDALKAVFRDENPLSHEDSTLLLRRGEHERDIHLVNVGRAFFGGTKPMYIFEDRNSPIVDENGVLQGYEQYLFKEAVNCVGFNKPEGALVTEAASKLQERICGPYSIPAYAIEHEGRILGSVQKKIESTPMEPDLFEWQANPQAYPHLTKEVTDEILREHTLDWLLCNFDTKGENFLRRKEDGHLCSFDKEASFSKLKDAGAAHMSTEYKPHSNDTIYNVIFREYAAGRQALDLFTTITQIETVEQISDDEYMQMFDKMLTQKYGRPGRLNWRRRRAERAILERKTELREEYRRFFEKLITQRREALAAARLPDDTAELMNEDGKFEFPQEKVERLEREARMKTASRNAALEASIHHNTGEGLTEEARRQIAGFKEMAEAGSNAELEASRTRGDVLEMQLSNAYQGLGHRNTSTDVGLLDRDVRAQQVFNGTLHSYQDYICERIRQGEHLERLLANSTQYQGGSGVQTINTGIAEGASDLLFIIGSYLLDKKGLDYIESMIDQIKDADVFTSGMADPMNYIMTTLLTGEGIRGVGSMKQAIAGMGLSDEKAAQAGDFAAKSMKNLMALPVMERWTQEQRDAMPEEVKPLYEQYQFLIREIREKLERR